MALDDVLPGRRVGVLEVRHEDPGAGVEGVDHHLPLGGARDLNSAVAKVGRDRGHLPIQPLPDLPRLGQEVRALAGVKPCLTLGAAAQQGPASGLELAVQRGDELERLLAQDLLQPGRQTGLDGYATSGRHASRLWRKLSAGRQKSQFMNHT